MTMIDTLIFDVSETLLNFGFIKVTDEMGFTRDCSTALDGAIHSTTFWRDLDRSRVTFDEALSGLKTAAGQYSRQMEYFVRHYPEYMPPIANNVTFLEDAKRSGARVLYLSDFHRHGWAGITRIYDFFKLFEGGVVSWECGFLKPDHRIFETLIEKYGLVAGNCMFFDDRAGNVAAAAEMGFHAVTFTLGDDIYELASQNGYAVENMNDLLI